MKLPTKVLAEEATCEDLERFSISDDLEKFFQVGAQLPPQEKGELEARDPRMQEYLNQVRHLQSGFEFFNLSQVPRSRNTYVDSLPMLAMSSTQSLPRVILIEDLCNPTKVERNMVHVHQIKVGPS